MQVSKNSSLKSLTNEQGGYVVFLVLREYSFIRNFRVEARAEIKNSFVGFLAQMRIRKFAFEIN